MSVMNPVYRETEVFMSSLNPSLSLFGLKRDSAAAWWLVLWSIISGDGNGSHLFNLFNKMPRKVGCNMLEFTSRRWVMQLIFYHKAPAYQDRRRSRPTSSLLPSDGIPVTLYSIHSGNHSQECEMPGHRRRIKHGLKTTHIGLQHESKSSLTPPPPKKNPFAILSLLVNLYSWKFSWLFPNRIPTCVPILVHLSKYFYEQYHFY